MGTMAFVGKSGTGKSHRAIMVAKQNGADGIIDDGLLISENKVLAGSSAKRDGTRIASVKHALFRDPELADEIKAAVAEHGLQSVMILGTSDRMVTQIADNLGLLPIEKIIRIEDVATPEEMDMAQDMRLHEGKHIIPVPTFEIKKDFSGYFMHPLKNIKKSKQPMTAGEKTIVRPTFSYLGNYEISDNVLIAIAKYEAEKFDGVHVNSVFIRKTNHGAHIDMTITVRVGIMIPQTAAQIQHIIRQNVECFTSVNARRVNIYVKAVALQ